MDTKTLAPRSGEMSELMLILELNQNTKIHFLSLSKLTESLKTLKYI